MRKRGQNKGETGKGGVEWRSTRGAGAKAGGRKTHKIARRVRSDRWRHDP